MKKLSLICLSLCFVLGQNFVSHRKPQSTLTEDQIVRISHAKELLGRYYKGSSVQSAEKIDDLPMAIREHIKRLLPKKFKSQAKLIADTIIDQANAHELDPVFVMAVIQTESGFRPHAKGSHGEIGLMQLKPDTAEWIAKSNHLKWTGPATLKNPVDNIIIGVAYISQLRGKLDRQAAKYVSAYNMGLSKMRRLAKNEHKPHEYSIRVMNHYSNLYEAMISREPSSVLARNFINGRDRQRVSQ